MIKCTSAIKLFDKFGSFHISHHKPEIYYCAIFSCRNPKINIVNGNILPSLKVYWVHFLRMLLSSNEDVYLCVNCRSSGFEQDSLDHLAAGWEFLGWVSLPWWSMDGGTCFDCSHPCSAPCQLPLSELGGHRKSNFEIYFPDLSINVSKYLDCSVKAESANCAGPWKAPL